MVCGEEFSNVYSIYTHTSKMINTVEHIMNADVFMLATTLTNDWQ